jgi:transposase
MAFRKISDDVKRAAIRLYERNLLNLHDILDCCGLSQRTWYRVLKLWRETGDVVNHERGVPGRMRHLDREDVEYLLQLVRDNPDYFLDELVTLASTNRFISVHFATVFNELERAGMSRKKLKVIASERNEELRAEFIVCAEIPRFRFLEVVLGGVEIFGDVGSFVVGSCISLSSNSLSLSSA